MLEDVLEFSGNRPVFDRLTELLKERQSIAFVGAGASAGLYPTWNRFIELLADHAVHEGKADKTDAERWKQDTSSTPQQRVTKITLRLGDAQYRMFLRDTFGPRRGQDGKPYTPTHALLMRLPFRGFVTTNYDPSLALVRSALRPDDLSVGTPTWQDQSEVYGWRTGDIFKERECPILWLHGFSQRPETIVLNSSEYGQAYQDGIYRDTFKELWVRERLLFVGFGFQDPHFTVMVQDFLQSLTDTNAVPRHIGILGWTGSDDGTMPDQEAIKEARLLLETDYHLRALFYPVRNGDHSNLQSVLEALASVVGGSGVQASDSARSASMSGETAGRGSIQPGSPPVLRQTSQTFTRIEALAERAAERGVVRTEVLIYCFFASVLFFTAVYLMVPFGTPRIIGLLLASTPIFLGLSFVPYLPSSQRELEFARQVNTILRDHDQRS